MYLRHCGEKMLYWQFCIYSFPLRAYSFLACQLSCFFILVRVYFKFQVLFFQWWSCLQNGCAVYPSPCFRENLLGEIASHMTWIQTSEIMLAVASSAFLLLTNYSLVNWSMLCIDIRWTANKIFNLFCRLIELVFCVVLPNYLNQSAGVNLWRCVAEPIGYHTSCAFLFLLEQQGPVLWLFVFVCVWWLMI